MEASALSAPAGLRREAGTSPWLRLRSDEQLVNLFRSGNDEAFRVIHDRYRQRLYAYSRQMLGGSGSDAEDVMQDVFLRAYRSLRADERPLSLRAWLYRVAHNRCVDHLRRPTPAPAEIFEMSRTPLHDPTTEVERREDLARLVADVRRLPDQQRSALLMREMDGMSYADLAVALETSVPAVKSLLVRARIGLVEAIEARDADCADIRHDLAASFDKGVRTSGRARRHLRECHGCTRYRAQLREVRSGFAALSPSPSPAAALAKLLGLGGAGSSAAAGGAAAGGSATAIGGGAAAAVSVTKVAVVVCCAVAVTGGAEVVQTTIATKPARSHHRHVAPAIVTPAAAAAVIHEATVAPAIVRHAVARLQTEAVRRQAAVAPARPLADNGSGGAVAPADSPTPAPPADKPADASSDSSSSGSLDDPLLGSTSGATGTLGSGSSTGSGSGSGSGSTSGSGSQTGGSGSTTSGSGSSTSSGSSSSSSGSSSDPAASSASSSSSSGSTSGSSDSTSGSGSTSGSTPPPGH